MILDLVFAAMNYALAHALLALVVVPPAVLLVRRGTFLPAATRAAIALGALVFLAAAPAVPGFVRWYTAAPGVSAPVPDVPIAVRDAGTGELHVVWPGHSMRGPVIPVALATAELAVLAWWIGTLWQLARLAASTVASRRAMRGSTRARELEARHAALLPAGTQIRLTGSLGPAAVGVLRPTIAIPAQLVRDLPEHALSAVLLHEGAHLARRDPAALVVQRAIVALLWWNPLVHLLARAGAGSREIATDARAAERSGSAAEYATGLVDAVSVLMLHATSSHRDAVHAIGNGDDLDERIHALIAAPSGRRDAANAAVVLLAMAAVAAIAALHLPSPHFGMWHPAGDGTANSTSSAPVASSGRAG